MNTTDNIIINDWLKLQAKNPHNEPMFRLVWSNDQRELRLGTYKDFEGKTFIRERTAIELVKKYPWLEDRWVLEQWQQVNNPELVEAVTKGSYEPIYIFENRYGPLPLKLDPVQFLIKHLMRPNSSPDKIKSTIKAALDEKERKIQQLDEDELDVSTDIQSNLHFGEAIIVPSNYEVDQVNLRNKS